MNWRSDTPDCDPSAHAAAYVLGALEPEEHKHYQEHLPRCTTCCEAVARLQPVADTLPAATTGILAPEELRERIMTRVQADAELFNAAGPDADLPTANRRRRPRRLAVLAGTAALACGTAIGALVIGNGPRILTQHIIHASVISRAPGAHAELRQIGTRAELVLSGMPQPALGKTYELWLAKPGQAPQPTNALFSVDNTGSASIDVPGNLHGIEHLMITTEPLGGSQHPTSPATITATL